MGKFDGILICTDLDGTLLNGDYKVSEENAKAIEYFKREGGYFTFITGRMYYYAEDIYEMVKPNAPIGCGNGAAVFDFGTGEYIWSREMDPAALELMVLAERELPQIGFNVNTYKEVLYCRESSAMKFIRDITGMPDTRRDHRKIKEPFLKIVFGHEDPLVIDRLEQILMAHPLGEKVDFVRAEAMLFEVMPKGIHKGIVLPILAKHLGIDEKRIIAIGDYDNDIGMLKAARIGIAVDNATPAAKAAADLVTVSNEDHAIAKLIADLESGVLTL